MLDLITWLRAEMDREAGDASLIPGNGYLPARWESIRVPGGDWAEIRQFERFDETDDQPEVCTAALTQWGRNEDEHVARYDPARITAEVAAKLAILDHAELWSRTLHRIPDGWTAETATAYRMAMICTLRLLALPYAGRPGYLDEWRPK